MTEFEAWLKTADMSDRKKTIALLRDAGETLRYVGQKFDISPERVRQIHLGTRRRFDARHIVAARLAEKELKRKEHAAEYEARWIAGVVNVDELEVGIRAANALQNAGVKTVEELYTISDEQFLRMPNVGRKTLNEIRAVLADFKRRHPLLASLP